MYLAVSPCGICCPFNVTAGQVLRFKEKVIWVNLFSLAGCKHVYLNKELDYVTVIIRNKWKGCKDTLEEWGKKIGIRKR
jgi:hypothetical protein